MYLLHFVKFTKNQYSYLFRNHIFLCNLFVEQMNVIDKFIKIDIELHFQ